MFSSFRHSLLTTLLVTAALAGLNPAQAQTANTEYTPQVGQYGKDVIWVPTPKSLVEKMLKMADVKPTDYVIDLGAGDGVTVITAAKQFGVRALGIEYNPEMVELAKRNAQNEGVAARAEFVRGDIFTTDFSQATVLTMYLLPYLNMKLRPTILNMKPGTRIVSHAFTMEDWMPDQTDSTEGRTAYLWIVPAKVEGRWKIGQSEIELKQKFQAFEGTYRTNDTTWRLTHVNLRGDQISFTAGTATYTGRVTGPLMQGTTRPRPDAQAVAWSGALIK